MSSLLVVRNESATRSGGGRLAGGGSRRRRPEPPGRRGRGRRPVPPRRAPWRRCARGRPPVRRPAAPCRWRSRPAGRRRSTGTRPARRCRGSSPPDGRGGRRRREARSPGASSGPEADEALVSHPEIGQCLVRLGAEGVAVEAEPGRGGRVVVGVAGGPRIDELGHELTPGQGPGGPEAGRGAEGEVAFPVNADQLVVAVELLAGAGGVVVGTAQAADGHWR